MSDEDRPDEQAGRANEDERGFGEESRIIVFGGNGCAGRGCLFWIVLSIVLSVALTVLVNLAYCFCSLAQVPVSTSNLE